MNFPRLVYKGTGQHSRKGGTYSYCSAENEKQFAELLADGWFETLPKAIDDNDNPKEEKEQEDNYAPTREELEEKAKELGIKFDGRTGDKKLLAMINEKL